MLLLTMSRTFVGGLGGRGGKSSPVKMVFPSAARTHSERRRSIVQSVRYTYLVRILNMNINYKYNYIWNIYVYYIGRYMYMCSVDCKVRLFTKSLLDYLQF